GSAALTIATMPARTASGRSSQRSTSRAKSGDFRAKSAKQDAKTVSPLLSLSPEVQLWEVLAEDCSGGAERFSRPAQSAAPAPLRTPGFSKEAVEVPGCCDFTARTAESPPESPGSPAGTGRAKGDGNEWYRFSPPVGLGGTVAPRPAPADNA